MEPELSAGTVEYQDVVGDGPAFVLLHGIAMDCLLWRGIMADYEPITGAWCRRGRWVVTVG